MFREAVLIAVIFAASAPLSYAAQPVTCVNGVQDGDEQGLDCGGSCDFACPTNYKSGISVRFNGTPGKDYAEEYLYFDKLIDDHKVVYIKAATPLVMEHNERNSQSTNGGSPILLGNNNGTIRYRVDRDLQNKYLWSSDADPTYPAYSTPFAFGGLNYGPEDPGVSVVGSTGPKPGMAVADRQNYYERGQLDSFGDEWHSISYADDDSWQGCSYASCRELWSSDGKTVHLVFSGDDCFSVRRADLTVAE